MWQKTGRKHKINSSNNSNTNWRFVDKESVRVETIGQNLNLVKGVCIAYFRNKAVLYMIKVYYNN